MQDFTVSPVRAILAATFLGMVVVASLVMWVVTKDGPTPDHCEPLLLQMGAGIGALLGLLVGSAVALAAFLAQRFVRRPQRQVYCALVGSAWTAGLGSAVEFYYYFEQAYAQGASLGDHGGFMGLDQAARIGLPLGGISGMVVGFALGLLLDRALPRPAPQTYPTL